jgi:hypothetical protein
VIELVDDLHEHVFGLRASGVVTADEYAEVVRPAVRAWVEQTGHLHALVILEHGFAYDKHGDWHSAADGVLQWPQWRRLGVLTDSWWLRSMAPLASPYLHGTVRAFPRRQLPQAVAWIVS